MISIVSIFLIISGYQLFVFKMHDLLDEETGRPAQKPYSGKLMLRVGADIHAAAATIAQGQVKSINQWASEVLDKAAQL